MMNYKLIDICKPKQWHTLPMTSFNSTGYPVYGANGIIGYYHEYNHKETTLAVTCRGATCGSINLTVPYSYITGNAMSLDDLDKDKAELKYLYYFLKQRGFNDIISGSAQPQIIKHSIENINIPLPPLEEQKKIAKVLSMAEDLIAKRKESIRLLDEYLKSTFLDMFGDPVTNPKGWEVRKLGEILTKNSFRCGPFGSQLKIDELIQKGIPVYGIDNVAYNRFIAGKTKFISEEKYLYLEAFKVEPNDLLITRTGTVGRVCLAPINVDRAIIGPNLLLIKNYHNIFLPEFLLYTFSSNPSVNYQINLNSPGATVAVYNTKSLKDLLIPIVHLSFQHKFAEIVKQVDVLKEQYKTSLQEMENLYNSLSQRAFKGELDLSKVEVE